MCEREREREIERERDREREREREIFLHASILDFHSCYFAALTR